MRLLLSLSLAAACAWHQARADQSYVTTDGVNRAPAVALHCVTSSGVATPCGTAANPLVVTAPPGTSSSTNQLNQIAIEQASASALGSTADAAFAGGSGTLVSLLKAVWNVLSAGVSAVPASGMLTSRTVTLPAQQSLAVFPANASRRYLSFQVPQSTSVWINLMGGTAAPNAPDCAYFAPGTFYESGNFVNRGVISVYAPIAVTFSAWEN